MLEIPGVKGGLKLLNLWEKEERKYYQIHGG